MKPLSTRAVALLCLLPFITAVDVGDSSAGDADSVDTLDTGSWEFRAGHGEIVLEAGDQAVITVGEQNVTVTHNATPSRQSGAERP